ncbi:MAG: hypothetical protein L3J69_02500 [Desulfobacula sp.]|nr:hypothetical protein [Desulfobacula sp.]
MNKNIQNPLFKKGIWIKEQQGRLTMGSLEGNDNGPMVLPDDLCSRIFEFENDMIEALYGDQKIPFNPEIIDIEKMLADIKTKFSKYNLRISFSGSPDYIFKGDYYDIFNIFEKLVLSSLSGASKKDTEPLIYINASVLENHLCIIYRDAESCSNPSSLKEEIDFIKIHLKGEISYKAPALKKAYYDIMIPSK